MYNLKDTITAISSGAMPGARHIIRVSGSGAMSAIADAIGKLEIETSVRRVYSQELDFEGMRLDAYIYVFPEGKSYTGDLLVELHVVCCEAVADLILQKLVSVNARLAEAGEFTARAYLNGMMDLTQAEAVAEIVSSSNAVQLKAAEKLLEGRLSAIVSGICDKIIDLMSLLEAELDFCEEEILFISPDEAVNRADEIVVELESLIEGNIKYQAMIGLPAVGIAGSPNAGKSSLLNALTGERRSIVSGQRATTRDVLTAELSLKNNNCIIFDCAGLSIEHKVDVLDEIAQQAAIEAINAAQVVLFCVDISKEDFKEDVGLLKLIKSETLIFAATKSDLVSDEGLEERISGLKKHVSSDFLVTSVGDDGSLEKLKGEIDSTLTRCGSRFGDDSERLAVTERHRQCVKKAFDCMHRAKGELGGDDNELAAMFLRDAYETLSGLEQEKSVDEQMLDRIFSKFCIGK